MDVSFPRNFYAYTFQTYAAHTVHSTVYAYRNHSWHATLVRGIGYVTDHEAVTKHCSLMRSAFQHRHLLLISCNFNIRIWYGKLHFVITFTLLFLEELFTQVRESIFPAFNTVYLTLKYRTVFNFSVLVYNHNSIHYYLTCVWFIFFTSNLTAPAFNYLLDL
jgi:hypothetical protein